MEEALAAKEGEKERLSHENAVFSQRTSKLRKELDTIAQQTRRLQQEKQDIAQRLSINEHRVRRRSLTNQQFIIECLVHTAHQLSLVCCCRVEIDGTCLLFEAADLEEEKEYYSMSAKELMASLSDLAVQKEMTEAELAEEVTARVKVLSFTIVRRESPQLIVVGVSCPQF